ncbi:hypothetical protein [[Flexibacter] sp. ATCC 35103]|uniref:hypothetical protein n=1 Tax=[Flexibacter] sp. ATCC 35103 TaxID=1937528 RepID=UPI0009C52F9A|nr:hypothetical protein [[Flexibacter] sp. ATCC 35103]OMQ13551.1 hypothetical protein BXU01_03475 [[Flexibacter] sp. ATCC 35103]
MNSAKGYYYDYEGNFLGGPYKGNTKVKVCKQKIREVKIEKNEKVPYDIFKYPIDLNVDYVDFIKVAGIVMGESSGINGYNLNGMYKILDNRIKNKYYISKEDSFLEKKNIAMCCISNACEYFKGIIDNGLKGNFSYAIGTPRYNLLVNEDIEKRNSKEELRISIKATLLGIMDYNNKIKKGIVVATHWDGVDVLENWNWPHERNRAGTIDIEGNFLKYINYLLKISHPKTGLKDCHTESENIQKKYDLEIDIKKKKNIPEANKQKDIEELEKRKNELSNFEKIKNAEAFKKVKEMHSSLKGKQLSLKEDFEDENTKSSAIKKGYLTMGYAGATIFYLEHRHKEFKNIINNQLKK